MKRTITCISLLILMSGIMAGSVIAQESSSLVGTVTQLAGQNVYLNVGTDQGIAKGDTLQLVAAGRMLLVLQASRKQCITEVLGASFPVTRGQRLTFDVLKGNGNVAPDEGRSDEPAPVEVDEMASIMDTNDQQVIARRRKSSKIEVDGRLIINLSFLESQTSIRSNAVAPVSRRYATPSLNLNATIKNLPSDVRLNIHVRSDYRYQSRNPIAPESSFRAYRLNLEKTLPFGEIQAGRFYNRYSQRGGYWDGLSFIAGDRRKGVGGSIGFMPDRANEGFTTQFPRYSLFAHYETPRKNTLRYRASVAYNEIQPSSVFLAHRYTGIEQRFDLDIFSINQDLQLDQDPVSMNWVVSHFQLNTRIKVGSRASLRGRYSMRQPYRMYNIDQPFLTRRDQFGGGLSFQFDKFSLGANYAVRQLNQQYEGQTVSGQFNTLPLTRWALSFSGSANRWESDFGTALFANTGIARHFGKIYARVNYGFYQSRSPNLDTPINMHRVSLSSSIPFSKSMYWNFRASLNQSEFLTSYSFNTSLQIRF